MLAMVLALSLGAQSPAENPPPIAPSLAESVRTRFANMLMREAYLAVTPTDLTPDELQAAIFISRKAALLQPENQDFWRMTLALATLSGELSPYAVDVSQEALSKLVKLCPADQVLRLRRILQDIDRRETATDRVQAFKKFLTPEAIKVIGVQVASRIAFDLALFELRTGDLEAFGRDLTQSLTLSPVFPAAAETAAGFINERIDDPVGESELLVTAAMANPIETKSWNRLAALLLQEGAYGSAARVYQIALQSTRILEEADPVRDGIVGDYALALWGADRSSDALQLLTQHIHDSSAKQAAFIQTCNPQMSKAECESVPYSIPSVMGMINATIRTESKDPGASAAVATMISSALEQGKSENQSIKPKKQDRMNDPAIRARVEVIAQDLLDAATVAVLLNADPVAVQGLVDFADEVIPLSDDAKLRFAAAKKLKDGDAPGALALMNQSPATQSPAQLVRAKALRATGDRKSSAKIFFDVARLEQGTLIGLFAASQLKAVLGTGIPPSELVGKLDGVVASIPPIMERYVSGIGDPVLFQVVPEKELVEPFDPMVYRLTVKNQSIIPLAITLAGPIKEQVLLQPRISSAKNPGVDRLVPQIIPIDRALELAPDESLSMNWDFGWTEVSLRIYQDPLAGGIVDVRGTTNYLATAGSFSSGPFGCEPAVHQIQVNGVRVTPEWISQAIAASAAPTTDKDLVLLALLSFAANKKTMEPETATAAWKAIAEGFAKLPPEAQAWLLLVGPHNAPGFEAVLEMARTTTSGDVRAAYILSYCETPNDSQIAAAIRSNEPFARQAADVALARFQRESVRADERMRGEEKGAGAGAVDKLKDEQLKSEEPPAP